MLTLCFGGSAGHTDHAGRAPTGNDVFPELTAAVFALEKTLIAAAAGD